VAVAFVVTLPINRALTSRGRGHAVVHGLHWPRTASDPGLREGGRGRASAVQGLAAGLRAARRTGSSLSGR
jgi:hypothetical protein